MAQIQTKDPDEMMECHKHCKLNFHTYHCQQGKEERTPKNKNMDGYMEGNVCIEFALVRKEEKLSKAKTNCLS